MTICSEWAIYVEPDKTIEKDQCVRNYFCKECGTYSGLMHTRRCVDSDENVHREYKIVCTRCAKGTSVHLSKNLTENCWKASNPNFNDDFITKNVSDLIRKGR